MAYPPSDSTRYSLTFTVPHSALAVCKSAIFATGAGTYPGGKYTQVCFQTPGVGEFTPSEGAMPYIGTVGKAEVVEEMKVNVLCVGREVMIKAVEALKRAHPYEEASYEVYRMEDI
ncbi:adenine deaminase [Pseudocyphellaria aurata]|nr:adenine deaminase [Pseudocyphellaria aurata]